MGFNLNNLNQLSSDTRTQLDRLYSQTNPMLIADRLRSMAVSKVFRSVHEAITLANMCFSHDRSQGIQAFAEIALLIKDRNPPRAKELVTRALYVSGMYNIKNEFLEQLASKELASKEIVSKL